MPSEKRGNSQLLLPCKTGDLLKEELEMQLLEMQLLNMARGRQWQKRNHQVALATVNSCPKSQTNAL